MFYDNQPLRFGSRPNPAIAAIGYLFSKPSTLAVNKRHEAPGFCGASFLHNFFIRLRLQSPTAMLIAAGKHLGTIVAPGTAILFHEHRSQITVVLTGQKLSPALSLQLRGLLAELNPQGHSQHLVDQTSVFPPSADPDGFLAAFALAGDGAAGESERLKLYLSRPVTAEKRQILNFCLQQLSTRITEARHLKALEKDARLDSLSGLGNRRYFDEALQAESARADRYRHALSLILLDLDHFKKINDSFGHQTGDLVLKELGRVLASELRASDIACRYGGEEFAIILPETGLREGRQIAERIRRAIARLTLAAQGNIHLKITASLGLAGNESQLGLDLVQGADKALYEAKQNGRNRVVVAQERHQVEPKYFEIVSQARL